MLNIRLEIARVDHRRCVEVLLPLLVEHCAEKTAPNELDRFLTELGGDAVPAACALLDEMGTDEKDSLIVWLISAHERRLRGAANRHLAELFGAPIIEIGRFSALDRPGTRLALLASQVAIDYPALLRCRLVGEGVEQIGSENGILKSAAKLALQMGTYLSPESLEKQAIGILNSAKVKGRLMAVIQDALRQEGLDITVEDMLVERGEAAAPAAAVDAPPDAYAQKLAQALRAKAAALHG